jgi:hypothetical protein
VRDAKALCANAPQRAAVAQDDAQERRGGLPNLIVIGTQKGGTTSLHYYLDQHPEIAMARAKELNFFVSKGAWTKGVDWYAVQFDPTARVRGESSPSYTNYPIHDGVPARMHSVVPDAKLVYLVRDPLERIVSQYLHDYSVGKEDRSIDDALADDLRTHPYVLRSKYFFQLEQYLPFFPLSRILVLSQEELLGKRAATMRRVFDFLGVDSSFYDPRFERLKHRTSGRRRRTRAGETVSSLARAVSRRVHTPRWIAWKAERLLVFPLARRLERPVLGDVLSQRLIAELQDDVGRLRELTGEQFEGWCI